MQQEKTSLSVAEYFRTPVDLSLSLCSGPDHFGVDKQCLMGYNFYAAEAFSCRGFLSQKVLLRFISFDDIAHCLTFSSSVAFAKQTIIKVSDLGESFLGELKKDNKYPFLTQEDQSALKHDDQLYVQVIDHGISLSVSHKNKNDRMGILEEFIALVSICLNTYRICPTSISLESFLITDENNAYALRWIPLMSLNDLYTDNDIVVLLNRLSYCAFFLACPSDAASLKELYLQQLAIASAAADNLKEGIDLDTSAIRELAEFGIDIGILHECLKLGIPFTSGSYFNGSCSISESLNRFLEKIKLILKSAENVTLKEENVAIAEILSGLIDDEQWLSSVVIAENRIATTVVETPMIENLNVPVVEDTVVLYSAASSSDTNGLEDSTLIIGVNN